MFARARRRWPKSSPAELALRRNSLTRTERGGIEAERELKELEQSGVFGSGDKPFQYYYQRGLNLYVQGLHSQALEQFMQALVRVNSPLEGLMAQSSRLLCLNNLGLPTARATKEMESLLLQHEKDEPEIVALTRRILLTERQREVFRLGEPSRLLSAMRGEWSQAQYLAAWAAALPYVQVDQEAITTSLDRLTKDVDFYLRTYRLQTLVGRAYHAALGVPVNWGDRCERLYLWTWRWLVEPSVAHTQALVAILTEIEAWDGLNVLSVDEMHMTRLALEWILLFEPSRRARWSALLRRLNAAGGEVPPLFAYEELWLRRTRGEKLSPRSTRFSNAQICVFTSSCCGRPLRPKERPSLWTRNRAKSIAAENWRRARTRWRICSRG